VDASKKIFVATGIVVFDSELFIGALYKLVFGFEQITLASKSRREFIKNWKF
jgi:hypothetical protein